MHRTTTTAAGLLLSVTVSALTGCVSVRGLPQPDPGAPASARSGPGSTAQSAARSAPLTVRGPAQEAMELLRAPRPRATTLAGRGDREGPESRADRDQEGSGEAGARARAREVRAEGSVRGAGGVTPSAPRPPRAAPGPAPRAPHHAAPPRAVHAPRAGGAAGAGGGGGMCGLGESYGHWPADSPQARICRDAYGG